MTEHFRPDRRKASLALAALAAASTAPALAQSPAGDYPNRVIRIVVSYPPGGQTDQVGRILAERMTKLLGQSVIVENRPGAGGMIGAENVARAPADGYSLLVAITTLVQSPALFSRVPYDATKDFVGVTELGTTHLVFIVNPALPVKTLDDWVKLVRANPGKYSFGSYGAASTGHLMGEVFATEAKIDMPHIAYKGEAPSVVDLISGQIPAAVTSLAGIKQHALAGKVRPLAVNGPDRSPLMPDVPTFKELGYPELATIRGWYGMLAPAATPKPIVAKLNAVVDQIIREPETARRLFDVGLIAKTSTSEAFTDTVRQDLDRWSRIMKTYNVKLD